MNKYTDISVVVYRDGTVKIIGNGGVLFEVAGEYVVVETYLDAKPSKPSGEVK